MLETMTLSEVRVQKAVDALKKGELIVMSDHENRENEGDLMMAAQFATPEKVNFLITHGRGLVCVSMQPSRTEALDLPPMVLVNKDSFGTAFTVSVDSSDVGTGISAFERSRTITRLADPSAVAKDFRRPGHIFPLEAKKGGVLERPGHTESIIDLLLLADLQPVGVICEILNEDGTMTRGPALEDFCTRHSLVFLTVEDLIRVRQGVSQ